MNYIDQLENSLYYAVLHKWGCGFYPVPSHYTWAPGGPGGWAP